MKRKHCDALVSEIITLHGLDDAYARVLRIYRDERPNFDGQTWMAIEMVRHRVTAGRDEYTPVASINAHQNRLEEILASSSEIATFLETGMQAMPPAQRLAIPEHLLTVSNAGQVNEGRKKASRLAGNAAHASKKGDELPGNENKERPGDVPF